MSDRLQPGDRVTHVKHVGAHGSGTVDYERSGFVTVRWDDGTRSTVWGADVTRVAGEHAA